MLGKARLHLMRFVLGLIEPSEMKESIWHLSADLAKSFRFCFVQSNSLSPKARSKYKNMEAFTTVSVCTAYAVSGVTFCILNKAFTRNVLFHANSKINQLNWMTLRALLQDCSTVWKIGMCTSIIGAGENSKLMIKIYITILDFGVNCC